MSDIGVIMTKSEAAEKVDINKLIWPLMLLLSRCSNSSHCQSVEAGATISASGTHMSQRKNSA